MRELPEALRRFKEEICEQYGGDGTTDDLHWYDMSVGYFLGIGVPLEGAFELASQARYEHGYWMED